ncbi:MAG: hypothetical protein Unbinned6004contig1002_18 [Prokaryotic dsDNA virus sp.]|nr:MAG: hypothetical protein Unbinned6004contig1002_18 [Prokaryotic dsDNA virus sp.]|tara:strand:- start:16583 stop:16948 length:366 start_codon:yes stop_codon:yes gene_type:complete
MKKSKGIGDDIAKFTKATGIDKLAKKVLGNDCGCEERRQKLNQMFPRFKNIRQFTEDEIKIYDEVIPIVLKNQRMTKEEKTIINSLYRGVFDIDPQWKSCGPCNKQIIDNLEKVYEKSCKV